MAGGLGLDELETLAFLADHDLALDLDRLDGGVLLGQSGFAQLLAELERGAVERRDFVLSLDEQVADAERMQRGQQMLDGADRAAAAGKRGVIAGVGDVLEADGNRSLVGERGE